MKGTGVFFGFPYYQKVDGDFATCVARMLLANVRSSAAHHVVDAQGANGVYVSNNRNILVRAMLRSGAEWLLMVDSDVVFKEDLPRQMVTEANEKSANILAADMPLGGINNTGMARVREGVWVPSRRSSGWHDGAATAMILIRRPVLEEMQHQFGRGCWFLHNYYRTESGEWIDEKEDMAFAARALKLGVRTWVTDRVWAMHHKVCPLPNAAADDGTGIITIAKPEPK